MEWWQDTTRDIELHAYMVSPFSSRDVLDEITGVDWTTLRVSAAYYSDTRTSATLDVIGDGWKRGTFVRITFKSGEHERTLGTYAVINNSTIRQNGQWRTTLEMQSMLYTMSLDIATAAKAIGKGEPLRAPAIAEVKAAGREYVIGANALQYRYSAPTVYEPGKSRLSRLFEFCRMSNSRLDVDPLGRVTFERYVAPRSKTPILTLSLTDEHGVVMDGIKRTSDWASAPNSVAVYYQYTDDKNNQHTVTAAVSAGIYGSSTLLDRGYNVVDYLTPSDMSPATHSRAMELARQQLNKDTAEKVTWDMATKYLPVWEGDVIGVEIPDGDRNYTGTRKCLVQNVEFAGPYMDATLTLKEVNAPDEE